jgi:hypothetical protein
VLGRPRAADAAIVLRAAIAGQHDHRFADQVAQRLEAVEGVLVDLNRIVAAASDLGRRSERWLG